jgi:DNA-binding response OmpR family regulator
MRFTQTAAPRGSETILLVDADPETRKLAAFMLGKQGYTIFEARNRAEALAELDRSGSSIELLLVDVKGRGWELAEEVRQNQPRLRVLFLCGDSGLGARIVIEQGFPFLRKPFTMAEIAGKVRSALDVPAEKVMTAGSYL